MKHLEDSLQEAIVTFFRLQYPNKIIYAIPNGGNRNLREAARMKRTGTLAGTPDLCIPYPFKSPLGLIQFGALYLELKSPKGRLSENQKIIIPKLQEAGNRVEVVKDLDDAIKIIREYLK